jgi:hypothetical protein
MSPFLSSINEQRNYLGTLKGVRALPVAKTSRILSRKVDCSLVRFIDCGRLTRDIVLGVVCGTTTGLFVAMLGDFF